MGGRAVLWTPPSHRIFSFVSQLRWELECEKDLNLAQCPQYGGGVHAGSHDLPPPLSYHLHDYLRGSTAPPVHVDWYSCGVYLVLDISMEPRSKADIAQVLTLFRLTTAPGWHALGFAMASCSACPACFRIRVRLKKGTAAALPQRGLVYRGMAGCWPWGLLGVSAHMGASNGAVGSHAARYNAGNTQCSASTSIGVIGRFQSQHFPLHGTTTSEEAR